MTSEKCKCCRSEMKFLNSITVINPGGNEETFSYFKCEHSGIYYVKIVEDVFLTDELFSTLNEIDEQKARQDIAMIELCREPHNKFCNCRAHQSDYRYG